MNSSFTKICTYFAPQFHFYSQIANFQFSMFIPCCRLSQWKSPNKLYESCCYHCMHIVIRLMCYSMCIQITIYIPYNRSSSKKFSQNPDTYTQRHTINTHTHKHTYQEQAANNPADHAGCSYVYTPDMQAQNCLLKVYTVAILPVLWQVPRSAWFRLASRVSAQAGW